MIFLDEVQINHNHDPTDKLHFESQDGAIYTLTDVGKHELGVRNTTNLEELFDGSCYASTYQTNGQCHIYQELPETAKEIARGRSKSIAASHEILKSRPTIPLRITASSASVPKFPYTMPNTPALSVFDQDTKPPPFEGFPYVESRPSTSLFDPKASVTSFPYIESRPSLASSSYLDSKPSTSNYPSITTPDDTPVSPPID